MCAYDLYKKGNENCVHYFVRSLMVQLRKLTPGNDWSIYKLEMNNFFEENHIKVDKRRHVLLLNQHIDLSLTFQ